MEHRVARAPQLKGLLIAICLQAFWFASVSMFITMPPSAQAETAVVDRVQLQLKPNRCVALHEGQVCYQTIQLWWSANQPGNYCLYQAHASEPIFCWQDVSEGKYQYEFSSDTAVQLQIIDTHTNTLIVKNVVEVAWVYKANTRRKTHWRLF
ncbi:hypothetical protein CBP51_06890 [Cellvibrio mixtus]|jgi:hypothetical protein|uniref:DUF3019 domain-containing protein n=1 Tax=Cellvibrio mixtus TaxID=39650 RepID=A0A266QA56_9GAMM|nr:MULTISPECIES: DUF3019 domain-containing protein [Cellvibrio]AQT61940.1 hypothetical protein B0D95_18865 [Cellvibrio sp. PSBB023]OZY86732.1 hypothetical protein CBP51_06890 [Cellvibrio mixtus]